jgi:hypothetical protein
MNREDIIRMAREAGWDDHHAEFDIRIGRFANLVAAAEREACLNCYSPDDTATDWADKIRARGQS